VDAARRTVRAVALAYPDPDLGDGVVRLRRWREDDLGCVREAATDPGIPEGTTVPATYTPAAGLAFVHRQWGRVEHDEGISLAVAERASDAARGLVTVLLRPQAGVAGIGYWIVPRARRRGLATSAVRLLSAWALADGGLARVEAWAEPANAASLAVLERAGFEREGVLRSFLSFPGRRADAVVLARVRDPG
jgi:[ribosomal protein S5]-alanine N-acetyltransferase